MSFKINTTDIDKINEIQCNYYRSSVYSNQYKNTQKNGGYIEIPIHMSKNEPTLASTFFEEIYIANKIYITYPLHKIDSIEYDGELTIEHSSISNEYEKAYSCFLLKTNKTKSIENSIIDRIIDSTKQETGAQIFELNTLIPQNASCIFYNSNTIFNKQKILIFTTPISVNSNFADFVDFPYLFNTSSNNYSLIPVRKMPIINNMIEGFDTTPAPPSTDTSNKTMYCQPISEIDNADSADQHNQMEPSYLVPVKGQYSNMSTTNQFLQITIYYCTFIVITLSILLILPNIYNILVIKSIKTYFTNKGSTIPGSPIDNTIIGINTLEFCVRLFFILFIIGSFIFGFLYNKPGTSTNSTIKLGINVIDNLKINTIVFGLYFFIILITCSLVITNAKEGLFQQNQLPIATSASDDFYKVIENIQNQFIGMANEENWIFQYAFGLLIFGIVILLIQYYSWFIGLFNYSFLLLTLSGLFGSFIIIYYLIFLSIGK